MAPERRVAAEKLISMHTLVGYVVRLTGLRTRNNKGCRSHVHFPRGHPVIGQQRWPGLDLRGTHSASFASVFLSI